MQSCYPSSFSGTIEEVPGIAADNFNNLNCRAYFLSHYHTDHIQGLHSAELVQSLEANNAYIYMSEPTAAIVRVNDITNVSKFVKALPLGSSTITLPSVPTASQNELNIKLTLIPAGHCFGSVMFLFETVTKNVLFTGDFRMNPSDLSKYTSFMDPNIDSLYVDTTFLNTTFAFPTRSESVQNLIDELQQWLAKDDSNRIALHTSANFGYEYVFNELSRNMGLKTYVNDNKWRFYSDLHQVHGVTNDASSTKIHLCSNNSDKKDHSGCLTSYTPNQKYLYVHFSAMKWQDEMTDKTFNRVRETRLDVCFATHCSRSELIYFVEFLKPNKIVGFPLPYVLKTVTSPLKNFEVQVSAPKKIKLNSPVKKTEKDVKVSKEKLASIFDL